ncbi:hypothetical protein ACTI_52020 [Actinoplanes sp. OR16]|uniref:CAP domain-containing protein n=1 Tax=Actinoplanes sp. OR16 TaxID=946334 RepID=UPI000F71B853|nr:CAP domain-containing protein [Actinoplanes sp. OR16]BBH68517.1 hypothetical protein ACTI_52020 [Actinoplanes sp. OR16]
MPSPTNRRIRYTLTAIGALGMIGAGSAAIIAGSTAGDTEIRLAATTPEAVVTAEQADEPSPAASLEASPSATASASAPASASASASAPSPSASRTPSKSPTATVAAKARPKTSKTATPTKTTAAPAVDESVAAEILRLVNTERQAAGCDGLTTESRLEAAAQKHSQLQADQNTMSHQLPGEASMGDRVTAEGYRWRSVGENVAAGYTSAESVMEGWMNSPGHKANILNCGYEQLGVGLASSSSGTKYWTQNFAAPA